MLPTLRRDSDLTGYDPFQELEGRRLTVTAERRERERVGILRRRARHVGALHHEVMLPGEVADEDVEAELDSGVLSLRLPKAESSRRRRIPIR